jgi:pilus assembly protein FimV
MTDSEGDLEADFTGLEIEGGAAAADEADDLDLSSDFGSGGSDRIDDEELVVADDANGLSTKLDLARAYLDMGDEEGAQQILDEVVAEGSDELKAEARALLDRIG